MSRPDIKIVALLASWAMLVSLITQGEYLLLTPIALSLALFHSVLHRSCAWVGILLNGLAFVVLGVFSFMMIWAQGVGRSGAELIFLVATYAINCAALAKLMSDQDHVARD